jgi:hypothetical protein
MAPGLCDRDIWNSLKDSRILASADGFGTSAIRLSKFEDAQRRGRSEHPAFPEVGRRSIERFEKSDAVAVFIEFRRSKKF